MKIERVDEQADGNVKIFLRVENGDDSVEKLRALAESESADLWKRRISADDEKEARKFYNAQISGKEYSVVILDVGDDINQMSLVDPYYNSYDDVEVRAKDITPTGVLDPQAVLRLTLLQTRNLPGASTDALG
mmetsp:Transcript_20431/g.82498  ORF Transcript_20431/g.82498 Transcript_20431/m.82498 type:complete len:133 (-) Transcript_20431:3593-3991(-)